MKFFLTLVIGIILIEFFRAQECSAKYHPYITTFDRMHYGFSYGGDHFIMYDDFKNTRVTSGFQKCSYGSCTCAVYVQKNRKLMFVDFCNVQSNNSPTSKIYGVSVERNFVGPKAIREIPPCPFISSLHENNTETWNSIPTILENFKCARLQGSNYYTYYLIRTVENHFEDSLLVKFQLRNKEMPILTIRAPNSAYRSTGGLCGRWDGDQNNDLYVLDRHGVESFVSTSNLTMIKDFWNLNSVYSQQSSYSKRCAECMLMSERSFYCPCDDFDLFDQNNYNLNMKRLNYCRVPMHVCVEKHFNIQKPDQNISSAPDSFTPSHFQLHTSTTPTTIKFEEAHDICWTSFMNPPGLYKNLINGCLDRNITIQYCIDDVTLKTDPSVVKIHIESSIDLTIQNILTNQSNCDLDDLQMLCPNNCSSNGVCKFEPRCILPGLINYNCSHPVKCECNQSFGGNDCSQDLTSIPELTIRPQFCDLRTENCSLINGFGYPFSTRDPIYVKAEFIEYDTHNREHSVTESSIADTITDNNILIRLHSLSGLFLYKNIHFIKSDFISRDSLAEIRIFISYSNATFIQWANMTLYDSKCRSVDQETGQLVFLNERCEIEGVCYIRDQTSQKSPNLICNPDESINSWTFLPKPDPLCHGKNAWTEWFNFDSPNTDGGDFELYRDYQYGCKYPSAVQAKTAQGIQANQTEQVFWLVPLYGFFCFNRENVNGCADYQIRQCCEKNDQNTSAPTIGSTTENFESTNPTKFSTSTVGDEHSTNINVGSLLRTLVGHSSYVSSLATLPNGNLASGSLDETIKIWNPQNGSLLRTLVGHSSYIYSLVALPNGNLASGSGDRTVKIWDPQNGSLIRTLEGHKSNVRSLAILANGHLASGSEDRTIKIWNPINGSLLRTIASDGSVAYLLAALPNGDLVSGSWDETIKIWNPHNGSLIKILKDDLSSIRSLVTLTDGNLASGSTKIKIWNLENGSVVKTLEGHESYVLSLASLPNGNLASGSWDETIKIWNPHNGSPLRTLEGHRSRILSLVSLPNEQLASGSYDTTIKIWKL